MACICSPFILNVALAANDPPDPITLKPPGAWAGFVLMFLFFATVIAISLMSSKRGHQD